MCFDVLYLVVPQANVCGVPFRVSCEFHQRFSRAE